MNNPILYSDDQMTALGRIVYPEIKIEPAAAAKVPICVSLTAHSCQIKEPSVMREGRLPAMTSSAIGKKYFVYLRNLFYLKVPSRKTLKRIMGSCVKSRLIWIRCGKLFGGPPSLFPSKLTAAVFLAGNGSALILPFFFLFPLMFCCWMNPLRPLMKIQHEPCFIL